MEPTERDVDELIAAVTPASRRRDAQTLVEIMHDATGADPEAWSGGIIGFGRCRYRSAAGTAGRSPIVAFAPRKAATTIYLLDGIDRHRGALESLGPHTTGVGCLYLKDVSAVDRSVLEAIVDASYERVAADDLGGGTRITIDD